MQTGKLHHIVSGKGYGFIKPDIEGDDIFLHFSRILPQISIEHFEKLQGTYFYFESKKKKNKNRSFVKKASIIKEETIPKELLRWAQNNGLRIKNYKIIDIPDAEKDILSTISINISVYYDVIEEFISYFLTHITQGPLVYDFKIPGYSSEEIGCTIKFVTHLKEVGILADYKFDPTEGSLIITPSDLSKKFRKYLFSSNRLYYIAYSLLERFMQIRGLPFECIHDVHLELKDCTPLHFDMIFYTSGKPIIIGIQKKEDSDIYHLHEKYHGSLSLLPTSELMLLLFTKKNTVEVSCPEIAEESCRRMIVINPANAILKLAELFKLVVCDELLNYKIPPDVAKIVKLPCRTWLRRLFIDSTVKVISQYKEPKSLKNIRPLIKKKINDELWNAIDSMTSFDFRINGFLSRLIKQKMYYQINVSKHLLDGMLRLLILSGSFIGRDDRPIQNFSEEIFYLKTYNVDELDQLVRIFVIKNIKENDPNYFAVSDNQAQFQNLTRWNI